ncbi:Isocitrate isopropylmalate dehydrogenase [Elasticomyces elasticus]|nr:Isocitrate isopropylmalate dehydrogenase [Elasticomyces elasticus]KAK4993322.1 Isocitrate isopropylmalate dehydrogenase [Elasticomyces elasticus]
MPKSIYTVAALPGDGIGPEVVASTFKVLDRLTPVYNLTIKYTHYDFGAAAYQRTGARISATEMDEIGTHDAVLLGAMGLPGIRMPNGTEVAPQIDLRNHFGLFASLRHTRLFEGVPTRLKAENVDILVIRETTEGMFAGIYDEVETSDDSMSDRMTITRKTSEKLFEVAFAQARLRKAKGLPGHVTLLHKSNVLKSNGLLVKVFKEVAARYPDCGSADFYVDAGAMFFVTRPEIYDVVVTENIFGDIVSEVAAGIVGGLGVAPSGDVSEEHGVFQPCHGSAPDIAGQGVANPVATWLSAAMMLDWLGVRHEDPKCIDAAQHLRNAIERQLAEGPRTRDIGGIAKTDEVTQALLLAIDGEGSK